MTYDEYRHAGQEHAAPEAAGQGLVNRLPHQRRDGKSRGRRGKVHHEGPTKEPRIAEAVFAYAPEDVHVFPGGSADQVGEAGTDWGRDERYSVGAEVGRRQRASEL